MYIYIFCVSSGIIEKKIEVKKKDEKKEVQELDGLLPILAWVLCHNTGIVL